MYGCYSHVYVHVRCRVGVLQENRLTCIFHLAEQTSLRFQSTILNGVDRKSLIATKGNAQNYVGSKKSGENIKRKNIKVFHKAFQLAGWPRSH